MTATPLVIVHPDKQVLADASGARLVSAVTEAQAARGLAHVVLTGGSMGSAILASVAASRARDAIDWSALHVWWGDERWLPAGDPERNETQNRAALLDLVPIPREHLHVMAPSDGGLTPEEAATAYETEVRRSLHSRDDDLAVFDVVLLGVGPDGHIASMFPGHPGLQARDAIAVAVHDSPKPPPTRISLTLTCLGRSREVWFLVAGADKATAVSRGVAGDDVERTPAAGVRGRDRTLWLVDRAAAGALG